ncbi:MAG: glycosyltransferase family 2 protein [Planctomycetota bacterium]|jgi:glycosyltransferase involved in cell wall biosynthesis
MFHGKKIIVVMPAYNAEKTIVKTYNEVVAQEIVDVIIVVDDKSIDKTVSVVETLKRNNDHTKTILHLHDENLGYGGNQKTCYRLALQEGADIVIMVHPDYQYTPLLIPAMAGMIVNNLYPCVLGSRILGKGAIKGGMPLWRYLSNRFLTAFENAMIKSHITEFHTGYRAFSKEILQSLAFEHLSNGFLFDNEILTKIIWKGYAIGEISCPTKYFPEASSISFWNSVSYGLGVLKLSFYYRLAKMRLLRSDIFS